MLYSEHCAPCVSSGGNSEGGENKQDRALIEKTSQAKLLIQFPIRVCEKSDNQSSASSRTQKKSTWDLPGIDFSTPQKREGVAKFVTTPFN